MARRAIIDANVFLCSHDDSSESRAQGQGLTAAADTPLAPRPPAPIPRVLIPTVRARQHPYVSTPAASRVAPSLQTLMLKGGALMIMNMPPLLLHKQSPLFCTHCASVSVPLTLPSLSRLCRNTATSDFPSSVISGA